MQATALQATKPGWTYSPHPAVEEALYRIRDKFPATYPSNLGHVRQLLARLGNPQRNLPFTFHVAGTNGKGSTVAFLHAILKESGLNAHIYTSPHLVRFEERIALANEMISAAALLELIHVCEKAAEKNPVSFFEFFTVVAFLAFAQAKADVLLLETGLGGLLDATNVIEGPNIVSVLTRISHDHTHILGESLREIATQKAGIIKKTCPVIVARQADAEVMNVFEQEALKKRAPFFSCSKAWHAKALESGFTYTSNHGRFDLPLPSLIGAHQIENAGAAIAAVENSPFTFALSAKTLANAMQNVIWPGRMQQMTKGALQALLPAGWELWLDGAHNDSGAEVVAAQASRWNDGKPLHLLTALKRTKDVSAFYQKLLTAMRSIRAIDVSHIEAPMMTAKEIEETIRQTGYAEVAYAPSLEGAIRSLTHAHSAPQRILVAGSLYLVGEALRA